MQMIAQSANATDDLKHPYLPNATFAQMALATNIRHDSLTTEPIAILFTAFGFSSEDESALALDSVADHYRSEAERGQDTTLWWPYSEMSVGPLGDDRRAFWSETRESALGSTGKSVHVVVQVGPNILYTWTLALSGDAIGFTTSYLEAFLAGATDDPESMLPELFDLPVGWELASETSEDILDQVTTEPTPVPTTTPVPTEDPSATPEESPTVVVIEPRDDEAATADDGEDDAGETEDEAPDEIVQPPDDDSDDGSGQQPGQGGDLTLSDAPVYTAIGAVPGDGDRLGLSADGELVFSVNPGRASLEAQGYVAGTSNTASGQVVQVCSPDGACVDASAGTAPGGQVDTPIGWLEGEVIYERQGGESAAIEYRAVRFVPGTLEVADDQLLGGGDADLEFFLRPYPVGGGLLVPTASSWLYVTTSSMQVIDANPYGENLGLVRVYPGGNLIAYVTGGTLVIARLDAPGSAIAELPFAGIDYDLAPNGDLVAVISDSGIEVLDLQGNVVASVPNDGGLALGGITWVNEGILYVDYSNGVIRIIPS
jgi:hypothetical protein